MKSQFKVAFLCASLLCSSFCNGQTQGNHTYDYKKETTYIKNTKVVNKEKFDASILDKLEGDYPLWSGWIDDNYIIVVLGDESIAYSITPQDSFFARMKIYDPLSKRIKGEGEYFNRARWRYGVWKFYDEKGRLEKEIDYERPFLFTLDDVLNYCVNNEIVIPFITESGQSKIDRTFVKGEPYWVVYSSKFGWLKRITLDGRTGKEIDRLEGQLH